MHENAPLKLGIMQPYFLPYIGYFQLIAAVDRFILYDNVKYTKKGWINRNRVLVNGRDALITLPLKADSDFLDVRDRRIADDFSPDKLLGRLRGAYRRAPNYPEAAKLLETIIRFDDRNLYNFIRHSVVRVCEYLDIPTPIHRSSAFDIDHTLKAQDKVIALCKSAAATVYINPPGGVDLYSDEAFRNKGIELRFLHPHRIVYPQFENEFVPSLSIADVIMFNARDAIRGWLSSGYDLG